MPSLIEKSPLAGVLPATHGGWTLAEVEAASITSVAAFPGQAKTVSAALKKAAGMPMPGANGTERKGTALAVWTGRDQCFVLGTAVPEIAGAAVTDVSDGWAWLRLTGAGAETVLARLVPLDLRPSHFGMGRSARAPLGHMQAVLVARADGFDILVFRSMAQTAWHEIETAMRQVAART